MIDVHDLAPGPPSPSQPSAPRWRPRRTATVFVLRPVLVLPLLSSPAARSFVHSPSFACCSSPDCASSSNSPSSSDRASCSDKCSSSARASPIACRSSPVIASFPARAWPSDRCSSAGRPSSLACPSPSDRSSSSVGGDALSGPTSGPEPSPEPEPRFEPELPSEPASSPPPAQAITATASKVQIAANRGRHGTDGLRSLDTPCPLNCAKGIQSACSKAPDPSSRASSQMHQSRAVGETFPWRAYWRNAASNRS